MKNWLGIIFFSNSDRSLSHKKRGTNPQRRQLAHDRNRDEPDEARNRTPARTNPHHATDQARHNEGKGSSARTRSKTAPDNRTREGTGRRTQQPGAATTRQSQTDHATERNEHARERRTRTDRKRRTHEKKPPEGDTTVRSPRRKRSHRGSGADI